jgi:hypothetical protein
VLGTELHSDPAGQVSPGSSEFLPSNPQEKPVKPLPTHVIENNGEIGGE